MRRAILWATAAVLPALLISGLTIGCSGNSGTGPAPATSAPPRPKGALVAVEATGKGTLKGKVTLAGGKPNTAAEDQKLLADMKAKDEAHCVAGATPEEKEQQHWRVADGGGLANVFVWVAPPAGKFFKIDKSEMPKGDVILDQPKCAFEPHAFVLFPKYRDPANPKKMKETGQHLVIKNSNMTAHNTDLDGGDDNPRSNNQIEGGKALAPLVLEPSTHEIDIKCGIHPWMNAFARAFDHPYATVTKADGTFEIKDVPAAEVQIVMWHELAGYGDGGNKGKSITVKAGDNPAINYEMKKQ